MTTTIQALGMEDKMANVMNKFDKVDVDNLDFDAFLGAFGFNEGFEYKNLTKGETDPHLVECRQMFQEFDVDHKGSIGANELKAMAAFVGETFTDKDIEEMIAAADIMDHDGKVGYEEF